METRSRITDDGVKHSWGFYECDGGCLKVGKADIPDSPRRFFMNKCDAFRSTVATAKKGEDFDDSALKELARQRHREERERQNADTNASSASAATASSSNTDSSTNAGNAD